MINREFKQCNFLLEKNFLDEYGDLITPKSKKRYQLGLYDHLLNEKETIEDLKAKDDSQWFRKAENKFLSFFEEIMTNETMVEISEGILSNFDFANSINSFDYEDRENYVEFIRCYKRIETNIFQIESVNDIRLFTKFLTREIHNPTFHFEYGKVNLLSNFDMFYPIFFENDIQAEQYSKIAIKNGLYILEIKE